MRRPERQRIPRWLARLLICVVASQATMFLVRPVITYRAVDLGVGEREVGLIVALQALLPALIVIRLGRYSDSRRPAPVLQAGLMLIFIACIFLAFASSFAMVAVAACILGLGSTSAVLGGQTLVARLAADRQLDRDFGWFTAAGSVGQMLGPAMVGLVISDEVARSVSTTRAFLLGAVLSLVALAAAWRYGDAPTRPVRGVATPKTGHGVMTLLRLPGMPGGLLVSLTVLTAVDILVAYLPLLGERRGISPAVIGLLLSLRAAASVLSRVLIPALLRRWPRGWVLKVSTFGAGLLIFVLPVTDLVWLMAILLVVIGFGLGLGQPLTMGLVAQSVSSTARGAALSIRLTGNKVGQVTLPAVIALAAGATGAGTAFVLLGGMLMASAAAVRTRPIE